ncbi:MAG: choice-of-anchor M domain-containing protein [Verrucomicrobiota bacterium]
MKYQSIIAAGLSLLLLNSASGTSLFFSGHGDLGIGGGPASGGDPAELELHYHLGEDTGATLVGGANAGFVPDPGEEFEVDEIVVRVFNPLPDTDFSAPIFSFLGPLGDFVYVLPEDEVDADAAGVPFLGIGAEELVPGDWTGSLVLTVDHAAYNGFSNPGEFSLYDFGSAQTGADTNPFISTSNDGGIGFEIDAGGHSHANWAFTAPGLYNVPFVVTGTPSAGGGPITDTATYQFLVIPEPSTSLLGLASLVLIGLRRTRRA